MLKGALPEEVVWACTGSQGKHEKGGECRGGKEPIGPVGRRNGGGRCSHIGRQAESEQACVSG